MAINKRNENKSLLPDQPVCETFQSYRPQKIICNKLIIKNVLIDISEVQDKKMQTKKNIKHEMTTLVCIFTGIKNIS